MFTHTYYINKQLYSNLLICFILLPTINMINDIFISFKCDANHFAFNFDSYPWRQVVGKLKLACLMHTQDRGGIVPYMSSHVISEGVHTAAYTRW